MPLHRERKRMRGQFERFDDAIRGARGDFQTGREVFHGLMVRAVDFDERPLRQTTGKQRFFFYLYQVRNSIGRELPPGIRMRDGAGILGRQILIERPTQRNVEDLQATANPKEWSAMRHGLPSQIQFEAVAVGVNIFCLGMVSGAIERRINIAAAGDEDAVEPGL